MPSKRIPDEKYLSNKGEEEQILVHLLLPWNTLSGAQSDSHVGLQEHQGTHEDVRQIPMTNLSASSFYFLSILRFNWLCSFSSLVALSSLLSLSFSL